MGKRPTESDTEKERWVDSTAAREYDMLRTEILQYLEEYQSVRNMMYAATAAVIGLNGFVYEKYFLFLLPLAIILPSYLVYVDYRDCVVKAAVYMQVFLEKEPGAIRWETRSQKFERWPKKSFPVQLIRRKPQELPYMVCCFLCFVMYTVGAVSHFADLWGSMGRLQWAELTAAALAGLALIAGSVWIFHETWDLGEENTRKEFLSKWSRVREEEMQ